MWTYLNHHFYVVVTRKHRLNVDSTDFSERFFLDSITPIVSRLGKFSHTDLFSHYKSVIEV